MKKFILLAVLASVCLYFSPNASAAGYRHHRHHRHFVHHKHHRHHRRHPRL